MNQFEPHEYKTLVVPLQDTGKSVWDALSKYYQGKGAESLAVDQDRSRAVITSIDQIHATMITNNLDKQGIRYILLSQKEAQRQAHIAAHYDRSVSHRLDQDIPQFHFDQSAIDRDWDSRKNKGMLFFEPLTKI